MSPDGFSPQTTTTPEDRIGMTATPTPTPTATSTTEPAVPTPAVTAEASPAQPRLYPIAVGLLAILTAIGATLHVLVGWTWPLDGTMTTLGVGVLLVVLGAVGLRRR